MHASGRFEVKMVTQPLSHVETASTLMRKSLDKTFTGDLEGTSRGEFVAAGTAVKGSAGYVALEVITGALHGRTGTFAMQHNGTMNRGAASLSVTVVPDSGTGELAGISGQLDIIITDGKHFYEFEYSISEEPQP